MNKLYTSGNYIVIESDGKKLFAMGYTEIRESADSFYLVSDKQQSEQISFASVPTWFGEDGVTAFTEETLRTLLLENTGFKTALGSSSADGFATKEELDTKLPNDAITELAPSTNLFDVDNHVVSDSGLDNDGNIQSSDNYAGWGRSILFQCVAGEQIHLQGSFGRERFAFYSDEGLTVLENNSDNHGVKLAPSGALYYAFNIYQTSNQNYSDIMLNKGTTALPYESFEPSYKLKDDVLEDVSYDRYVELKGGGEVSTIKGDKFTRDIEPFNLEVPNKSLAFQFNTDYVGSTIVRLNTNDDVAPSHMLSQTLLANHSYRGSLILSTGHGKTIDDVGSVYDNSGVNHIIVNIVDDNYIWMLSESVLDIIPEDTTLAYISGGVSSTDLVITDVSRDDLFPSYEDYEMNVYVDGLKIEEEEVVKSYSNNVSFNESYNLISRESLLDWYKNSYDNTFNAKGDVLVFNNMSYIFDVDGNCTIAGNYTFNAEILVSDILGLQAISQTSRLQKYYIPKTIEFTHGGTQLNYSMLEDASTTSTLGAGSIIFTSEKLDSSLIISDRWLQLSDDGDRGFAMGFLPVGDAGLNRSSNVTTYTCELRSNTNKMYPRLVDKGDYTSTVGESYSYVAYRCLFETENGATANYPVRTNTDDYYYIDYHNTSDMRQITMPSDFVGREFEIVEQRNITTNQSVVSNKLTINVDCLTDYGYIVIKVK